MRSRKAVDADELCVGSAALLHAVTSALVSATGIQVARWDGPGVTGFVRLRQRGAAAGHL